MKITEINVPIAIVASVIIFTITSVFTVEYRYAKAEDVKQFQYQQAVKDDRQWIEILEEKLDDAESTEEREKIIRQIERTEESLYINMERAQ